LGIVKIVFSIKSALLSLRFLLRVEFTPTKQNVSRIFI
jgi:hypothetical protein